MKHKVLLIAALIILLFSTIYQANTVDRTDQLFWFSHSTLVTFTKELAFACLIAWIIINSVEANHRRRNENMTDRFLSQQLAKTEEFQNTIAKDVFAAVFSTRVPRQLVDAVVDQVLGTEIVRLNHRADYVIEELPAGTEEIGEGYVLLAVKTEYAISNVSNKSVKVPIRVGYPTPGPKAAKGYSKLRSISIGDRQLSDEEIAEGDTAAADDVDKIRFVWWRDLGPGERLSVETVCELVKERSDNELWVSLFPSMGMELSLLVKVEGVQFGVRSCSRSELEQQMGGMKLHEHNRFKLDGPVLPHQSIVIWWRPE